MGKVALRLDQTLRRRLDKQRLETGEKIKETIEKAISAHHQRLVGAADPAEVVRQLAIERRHATRMSYRTERNATGTELSPIVHAQLRDCVKIQQVSESMVANQALIAFFAVGVPVGDVLASFEAWLTSESPLAKAVELQAFLASRADED